MAGSVTRALFVSAVSFASLIWGVRPRAAPPGEGQGRPQPHSEEGRADRARACGAAADCLFVIGRPDASAGEFALAREGYAAFARRFARGVRYEVGKDGPGAWPFVHPAPRDVWAGGRSHTFTIRFRCSESPPGSQYLVLGLADSHPAERSIVAVSVNGAPLPPQRAPAGEGRLVFEPGARGSPQALIFEIPAGAVRRGANEITVRLEEQSWVIYDYVALRSRGEPLPLEKPQEPNLLSEALAGPLRGTEEVIFAVREPGKDPHWYANFGYYAEGPYRCAYGAGGRLCALNLRTGKVRVLLDDPEGGVRDPQVHYDGRKILFSYRPGGEANYHLYEIQADGSGLRRLTSGPYDDIEPAYLPDGGIVFCSSRARRWVNCWLTQVATLHRADGDGRNVRMLSANNEHDNTPAVLPDGRILHTRWEYVDRSQVHFHHLWTMHPDGTESMVFFGNQHPGTTMIDAKPIPGTRRIVCIFSPGHGQREHAGAVTIVDPVAGPDNRAFTRRVHPGTQFRDPYPLSENLFLVARGPELLLMDASGRTQVIHRLSEGDRAAGRWLHEPWPLRPRPRERVIPSRVDPQKTTGRFILADVYEGRNMAGVRRGEIKELLVLETLPKPINFTGGMEPLSYGGTFTLERILGTVPVEEDGSAYFEAPALRGLFFVALDEKGLSVKRMQSFVTLQPGEVTGCVGCHEERTRTLPHRRDLLALRRPPSRIEPIPDTPDVFDFPRDIQPILDRHCVPCHGYEKTARGGPRAGGVVLTGDRGPMFSHSYFMLSALRQVADGRNLPKSNYPPRGIGSSASPLMAKLETSHYGVAVSERERRYVRLWIDSGAPYPGTYAALGTGMIGGYRENRIDRSDLKRPPIAAARETLRRRCGSCHRGPLRLPESPSDNMGMPPWAIRYGDPRLRFSRHILYNLSRPEKSLLLLAPLSEAAAGFGVCERSAGSPVFRNREDPDYRTLLAGVEEAKRMLEEIKRFDMPGFRPDPAYIREMQRYGILPPDLPREARIDPYATDRAYWRSLWYRPPGGTPAAAAGGGEDPAVRRAVEADWELQDRVRFPLEGGAARGVKGGPRGRSTPGATLEDVLARGRKLIADLKRLGARVEAPERELERIAREARESPAGRTAEKERIRRARWAVRRAAFSNPLLDFDRIVFIKRVPGIYSHMSDENYGWWARPGGGVYILEGFKSGRPRLRSLTDGMEPGSFLGLDLSYDGRSVLFSYAKYYPHVSKLRNKVDKASIPEDAFYHVYAVGIDGSGLRRLTSGRWDDFDARWLPDGDIVFLSTRRGRYVQYVSGACAEPPAACGDGYVRCGGGAYRPVAVYTLHRMNAEGGEIRPLSAFENFEWSPSVAPDGTLLYARWDYVDRDNMPYMGLWSMRPDGSFVRAVYGNHTRNPYSVFQARAVPGSRKIVFTASAHHSIAGGSLVLFDPAAGTDGAGPIVRLTPEVVFPESEGWSRTYYRDPYPLSERYYLVSWSAVPLRREGRSNPPNALGLYLFDAFGNLELIYRDPDISSCEALPLRPRSKPHAVPEHESLRAASGAEGRFLLIDVYRGLDVPRGTVKALRIVGVPPKTQPEMNTPVLGLTRDDPGKFVIGTVPVEEDGSAYFTVPAGVSLFFQALDADGMAVQTMRSATSVLAGETQSCTGCHEDRGTAVPNRRPSAALREPSKPAPPPEGAWPLRFDRLVQPVLDRYCTECHRPESSEKKAAAFDLTPPNAYENLVSWGEPSLKKLVLEAYRLGRSIPGKCGARASPLTAYLRGGRHYGVDLDRNSWERFVIWMDTYAQRRGAFDARQEEELVRLRRAYHEWGRAGNEVRSARVPQGGE